MLANPFAKPMSAPATSSSGNPFGKKLVFNKPSLTNTDNVENNKEESTSVIEEAAVVVEELKKTIDPFKTIEPVHENTDGNAVTECAEPIKSEDTNQSEPVATESENVDETISVDKIEESTSDDIVDAAVTEEIDQPKKRSRKRKASANNESAESNSDSNYSCVFTTGMVHNNSTVSFSKAIEEFSSVAVDENWLEFKKDIEKAYENISIPTDLNSASMLNIICQLSNLRNRIWNQYQYYKNQYDAISSKEPEGLIERIKRINVNEDAANESLRRRSGIIACINYKTKDGEIINLYDLFDEVRARYTFLNTIMNNIEFQKNLLITASSALKLENSLTTD